MILHTLESGPQGPDTALARAPTPRVPSQSRGGRGPYLNVPHLREPRVTTCPEQAGLTV